MIKELVKNDTEFLSKPAEPATAEDAQVAQDLRDTMESRESCACLAANQIGSTKAIIAFSDKNDKIVVMFNPKIKAGIRPYKIGETCLSLDEPHTVTRYFTIRVTYDALIDGKLVPKTGRYEDWVAQAIQHAIDHCNGKLV